MTVRACIFDLFGTLVPISQMEEYYDGLRITARVVHANEDAFLREWQQTHRERNTGALPTLEANVMDVCRRLGLEPRETDVVHGLEAFRRLIAETLYPKPESETVLREIRGRGLQLGLISGCNPEVPHLFRDGPLAGFFDELIFSCEAALMKPEPEIYLEMVRRLQVRPDECLYIGDGHGKELAGASAIGMTTVLVDYDDTGGFIWDRDREADYTVQDLRELFPILDRL